MIISVHYWRITVLLSTTVNIKLNPKHKTVKPDWYDRGLIWYVGVWYGRSGSRIVCWGLIWGPDMVGHVPTIIGISCALRSLSRARRKMTRRKKSADRLIWHINLNSERAIAKKVQILACTKSKYSTFLYLIFRKSISLVKKSLFQQN